jgi:hypothetical protein
MERFGVGQHAVEVEQNRVVLGTVACKGHAIIFS